MKKLKVIFTAAFMLCVMFGFSAVTKAATLVDLPITVTEDYTKAYEMFELINEERVRLNLEPYILDPGLMDYSMQRAAECGMVFDHTRPEGKLSSADGVGEDIAAGLANAVDTFSLWQNSGIHYALIKHERYKYCGIGCAVYDGTRYWVLNAAVNPRETNKTFPTSGTGKVNRTVQWDIDYSYFEKEFYIPRGTTYYGDNDGKCSGTIRIKDPYQGSNLGYEMPASMLDTVVTNPEILYMAPAASGGLHAVGKKTGTTTVQVSLKGHSEVSTLLTITVKSQDAGSINGNSYEFTLEGKNFEYTGEEIQPKLSVAKDCFGNTMTEGVDYKLTYENNINIGTGTAYIWLIGNYEIPDITWFGKRTFLIVEPTYKEPETEPTTPGGSTTPEPSTPGGSSTPTETEPSTSNPGTLPPAEPTTPAQTEAPQPQPPAQTEPATKATPKEMTVKLTETEFTYTGKDIEPSVKVYVDGSKIAAKYYKVVYKNNKAVGEATVKIKGKDDYKDLSAKTTFIINPKTPSVTSLTTLEKKKMTVNWKKVSGVTGYKIQYALDKKFTNSKKSEVVKGATKTSCELTGLKKGTTYYVRVMSYQKVDGVKYYSAWSAVEKKKTKS